MKTVKNYDRMLIATIMVVMMMLMTTMRTTKSMKMARTCEDLDTDQVPERQ